MYLYQTALLVMAVTTTLCPLATTYYWLVVYTLLFGIFDGAFVSLIAVLTGDVVGHHRLSSALGFLYLVFSVPIMTGSLIAGMISSNKMANVSHINYTVAGHPRSLFASSRNAPPQQERCVTRQTRLQGRPASGMTANLVSRGRDAVGHRHDGDLMTKGTPGDEVACPPSPPNLHTGDPVQFILETYFTCNRILPRQPVDISFREIFCLYLLFYLSSKVLYYLT